MMTWIMKLVRAPMSEYTRVSKTGKPQLSREEVTELFADELARPALQKHAEPRTGKPRKLMAGRQFQNV
jgi:hypothetical protein